MKIQIKSKVWYALAIVTIFFLSGLNYTLWIKDIGPTLNIISGKDLPKIFPHSCPRVTYTSINTTVSIPICIKDPNKDPHISRHVITGAFEKPEINYLINVFKKYPKATFLDLGANIGVFSLIAAAIMKRVISVDPIIEYLSFIRMSSELQENPAKIDFVNNAISDKRQRLIRWAPKSNFEKTGDEGFSFVTNDELEQLEENLFETVRFDTVTFEDILDYSQETEIILKIDVEGHECKVLKNYLQDKNKSVYIPYILVEFIIVLSNIEDMCPDIDQVIQGFYDSGYKPINIYSQTNEVMKRDDVKISMGQNIVWVHKNARTF